MLALTGLLIVIALMVGIGIGMSILTLMRREEVIEERVHDHGVNTVEYLVPDGVDPSIVRAALKMAGFTSAFEDRWGVEHLLIACPPREREQVRRVIAEVQARAYVPELHLDVVRFQDEVRRAA
jgi:hypothetical protein